MSPPIPQNPQKISIFSSSHKIFPGLHKDYFIITGSKYLRNHTFPKRDFYWSYEDFRFAPLNKITDTKTANFLAQVNTFFTGEHDKVLRNHNAGLDTEFDPENDDRKQKF